MAATQSWTSSLGEDGSYQRKRSAFHDWIKSDGSSPYTPEKDRYHLYVSLACPWAHRTLIMRRLKGLEGVIGVTVVDWLLGPGGWNFTDKKEGCSPDPINNFDFLRQVYMLTDPEYSGNITVPALFDKKTQRIVNNESSEIIRILNKEFNALSATPEQAALDFYPDELKAEIDAVNEWVYPTINNGVYRCGFASKQEPYEKAFHDLFASLDRVEAILSSQRYIVGDRLTEADIRLFTTLIRFDAVYVLHFKANLRRIADYPNIYNYMKEIYQMPAVKPTVDFVHIKHHYFVSHTTINPYGVVPLGPDTSDLETPFKRPSSFAAKKAGDQAATAAVAATTSSATDGGGACMLPTKRTVADSCSSSACALPKH